MNKNLLKVSKNSLVLKPITDSNIWNGTNIAEAFSIKNKTRMAAGIHEIFKKNIKYFHNVDDILYIISGAVKIKIGNLEYSYEEGEFVYIFAGSEVNIKVEKYVKLLYITYPIKWKS